MKGIKKSISREQIIETALDLLKDNRDIRSINLREIARVLGCAHTNLYNYFPSYNALLWEAHMEIENKFIAQISSAILGIEDNKTKLTHFFLTLASLYLDHKGWFRLAWLDYIDDVRPEKDEAATKNTVDTMVEILEGIWLGIYPESPGREQIHQVLHDVHCYMVGEVSNFINGRGLIEDEKILRSHIAGTSTAFFTLRLANGGMTAYGEL